MLVLQHYGCQKYFLGFLVKVACTLKNIFQYLLLLNFCLRSSQRASRESRIIVGIIQELVQNLKHTNVSIIFQNNIFVHTSVYLLCKDYFVSHLTRKPRPGIMNFTIFPVFEE